MQSPLPLTNCLQQDPISKRSHNLANSTTNWGPHVQTRETMWGKGAFLFKPQHKGQFSLRHLHADLVSVSLPPPPPPDLPALQAPISLYTCFPFDFHITYGLLPLFLLISDLLFSSPGRERPLSGFLSSTLSHCHRNTHCHRS